MGKCPTLTMGKEGIPKKKKKKKKTMGKEGIKI
jgi:hypothetical protein